MRAFAPVVLALGSLTVCVSAPTRSSPTLVAESIAGEGKVLFKVTNISSGPLLIWQEDNCGLGIPSIQTEVRRADGTPVAPGVGREVRFCGLRGGFTSKLLLPGDFLLGAVPLNLPAGQYEVRQTVTLTFSRDGRTDEQRRVYGSPAPDSGCQGIPCPPEYRVGMAPGDPFNPHNMPREKVTLRAPPLILTVP